MDIAVAIGLCSEYAIVDDKIAEVVSGGVGQSWSELVVKVKWSWSCSGC